MEISEKTEKIVAAVFASRGKLRGREGEEINVLKCLLWSGVSHYDAGDRRESSRRWEIICTIEEYNQCIEDMARAEWMSIHGTYHNYTRYQQACKSFNNIDTSNKELLAKHCDYSFYDKPLVYDDIDWNDGFNFAVVFGDSVTQFKESPCRNVYGQSNLIRFNEAFIFDLNYYTLIKRRTPAQIKQDKVDAQAHEISEFMAKHGDDTSTFDMARLLMSRGYIVEPK